MTYDISDEFEPQQRLQTLLRFFVNKFRKGHLIKAEAVRCLRKALQVANWRGCDEDGEWTQEDVGELFMFITETFELPYLPVSFFFFIFNGLCGKYYNCIIYMLRNGTRTMLFFITILVSNTFISWC